MEYVFPLAFGVHILSYCRSFLARRKHFRYKWLYTYLHSSIDRYTHARTHTYFREIFRKGGKRRMETQHGPVALLPFPVQTAGICFYHMWLLPQSALTLPGCSQPSVAHSFLLPVELLPLHLFKQLPLNQQSLTFFLYATLSLPLQTLILHVVHGWMQTVPTNMMTKPYNQTHPWPRYSGVRNKVENC